MTCKQGRSLRFPVALALISLSAGLSGCGGGSGSDEPSPNPAPPAPTLTLNTFSTQIIYRDECGEAQPHPYAEVFLHP